ncbi:helix-turn-helix domain-containing protein [Leifsonia poae]|uniref:helix-turn-helix domain-containing protein n=1 Tax=Leifsonia poae TaxID=110933 RepID=UPI001CC0A5A7|nr:helix-turn-helix domain-containing protein [Leifsonia poae]
MTEFEASEHCNIPVNTLRAWRQKEAKEAGSSPLRFHRIGRLVRYVQSELDHDMAHGRRAA